MRQTLTPRTLLICAAAISVLITTEPAAAQTTGKPPVSGATAVTRRVIVSLPHRKLAVLVNDEIVRVFPVAVGAAQSPSPVGRFTIVNRLTNPTYYRPGKVIGPGSSNPLGTRWLGLDVKGYGIHGTDDPRSIGYARSHGCIRLRNSDVEQLFELLRPGDVVEVQDERVMAIDIFGELTSTPTLTVAQRFSAAEERGSPEGLPHLK